MIKNYIFDFGNVLARFYPDELTAPTLPMSAFLLTICQPIYQGLSQQELKVTPLTETLKNCVII